MCTCDCWRFIAKHKITYYSCIYKAGLHFVLYFGGWEGKTWNLKIYAWSKYGSSVFKEQCSCTLYFGDRPLKMAAIIQCIIYGISGIHDSCRLVCHYTLHQPIIIFNYKVILNFSVEICHFICDHLLLRKWICWTGNKFSYTSYNSATKIM